MKTNPLKSIRSSLLALAVISPLGLLLANSPLSEKPLGRSVAFPVAQSSLHSTLQLEGASKQNKNAIVKAAKTAGAKSARYNSKKNTLRISGAQMNLEKIIEQIQKDVPGVKARKT